MFAREPNKRRPYCTVLQDLFETFLRSLKSLIRALELQLELGGISLGNKIALIPGKRPQEALLKKDKLMITVLFGIAIKK